MKTGPVHPVDEMLPAGMLFAFGLQHALVMYAGTVAVPLVFAAAMSLSADVATTPVVTINWLPSAQTMA
ncbi:solute carrier family 23 protein [Komagataeibacter swingsii]|uniref:solute carrier family 23 protein n=1 Tax=Komagataeibacter swingsii TaxID=215220 RepID=UPI00142E43D7|nr:solute carrier family 23 protein [Komagataeibacter swingsii]